MHKLWNIDVAETGRGSSLLSLGLRQRRTREEIASDTSRRNEETSLINNAKGMATALNEYEKQQQADKEIIEKLSQQLKKFKYEQTEEAETAMVDLTSKVQSK